MQRTILKELAEGNTAPLVGGDVEIHPALYFSRGLATKAAPGKVLVYRGQATAVVGERYRPFTDHDAEDFVSELTLRGGYKVHAVASYGRFGARRIAVLEGPEAEAGDTTTVRWALLWDHLAKGSVRFAPIPYRLFCTNQLAGLYGNFAFSVRHSGDVSARLLSAADAAGLLREGESRLIERMRDDRETPLTYRAAWHVLSQRLGLTEDADLTARQFRKVNNIRHEVIDLFGRERRFTVDGFAQALTDWATHGRGYRTEQTAVRRLFEGDDSLVYNLYQDARVHAGLAA